jgi:hypothetical protein
MAGITVGTTHTTIGVHHTDHTVGIGIGTHIGVGTTHIIGAGDIHIITTTLIITTIDRHTITLRTTPLRITVA